MGNKHKQPVIGITMSLDDTGFIREGVDYNFIRREYGKEVQAAGGQPIFLDTTIDPDRAAELCDGIIISGGQDIDPYFYGQEHRSTEETESTERTAWERQLINACDRHGVRILGICYGSQLLNVHYGGTLFQDVALELGGTLDHGTSGCSVMQRVRFNQDFLGFSKDDFVETAHRHHQAVNQLAPGFKATATSLDGVIEAIAGNGHYGIQWHSESDGTAPMIYGSFIALCAGKTVPTIALDLAPETT